MRSEDDEEVIGMVKILGWTDEINTCEHCGRTNLKGTLVLEVGEGNVVHYGSVCGVRVYHQGRASAAKEEQRLAHELEKMARDAERQKLQAAFEAYRADPRAREAENALHELNALHLFGAPRMAHPLYHKYEELTQAAERDIKARFNVRRIPLNPVA